MKNGSESASKRLKDQMIIRNLFQMKQILFLYDDHCFI